VELVVERVTLKILNSSCSRFDAAMRYLTKKCKNSRTYEFKSSEEQTDKPLNREFLSSKELTDKPLNHNNYI